MSGDHVVTVEEFVMDAQGELTGESGTYPTDMDIPLLFCDGGKTFSILSTYPYEYKGKKAYMVDIVEIEDDG